MKLHFKDQTFSFELLRAASYGACGGSEIGECLATADRINDDDFESWHVEWLRMAEQVEKLGEAALRTGHSPSGQQALLRASNYYRTAEFFLAPDDLRRLPTYEKSRATFWRAMELSGVCVEHVRIPYEGVTLPGYFYRPDDARKPRPTVIAIGGFDSTGEELYFFIAAAALQHGYDCPAFDGPGQGELLRIQHVTTRPDYEAPIGAAIDFALKQPDVDADRLAL